ncbi:MAG: DUF350 domain-containing protein [Actinomycetota bacterium]|nr:DUF350 domain-containing protein [Actinomycetota bacterium]
MNSIDLRVGLGDLLAGLGAGVVWGAMGIVLLALGYVVIDRLTPGELGQLICEDRNVNAAVVLASGLLAIGIIITTSILTSLDGFVAGVVSAFAYGLLGIALLAVSFLVVDRLTPGELGQIVTNATPSPAAWVVAANHLALGAILAAAIS